MMICSREARPVRIAVGAWQERTVDALKELTKSRTYDELRTHRKDGLSYKERRLILPKDAALLGETGASQTAGVCGT